jgi:uracil-DNA glycosylase
MSALPSPGVNAPHDCPLCPRLVTFREENRATWPGWFNDPVPNWGDPKARLAIVGLAPGLRGANRTGRPFTGDYAGDLLYATLLKLGLATGTYEKRPDDSLQLVDVVIANGVRCVPPQNKPTPAEIKTCRPFLSGTLDVLETARVYLALGRIAHDTFLKAKGERLAAFPFGHGAEHALTDGSVLFDSYHCSRYNTSTGVLTAEMFEEVMGRAAKASRLNRA